MSTLKEMYPGISFSPPTTLTASISNSDTEIYIEDSGCLPDAPNYATLGVDENAEVIFYREKELGLLKDCVRAVEGNAKSWPYGTEVARHFTESDYAALVGNVNLLSALSQKNTSDINERVKKFFTNNMGETYIADSDDGYMRNTVFGGKSVQDAVPTPDAPQEIKSVENVEVRITNSDEAVEQKLTLPYVLRGLPVSDDGNYTDKNGQQWVCDEVDVERGVLIQRIIANVFDGTESWSNSGLNSNNVRRFSYTGWLNIVKPSATANTKADALCSHYAIASAQDTYRGTFGCSIDQDGKVYFVATNSQSDTTTWKEFLAQNPVTLISICKTPIEIPLTDEEVEAYKALTTHYGGTNIFFDSANGIVPNVNFDYPCAIDGFVEYIKAQMGDTREFVYDMDSRISDDEILSAMAYVNSEYAAALLELEV